jgi:hypothetical protein
MLTEQTRTPEVGNPHIRAPQARAPKVELSRIEPRSLGPGIWSPDPLSPDPLAPSPPPTDPSHALRPSLPSAPSISPQHTSAPLPTDPATNRPVPSSLPSSLSVSPQYVVPTAPPGLAGTHPLPFNLSSAPAVSPQPGVPTVPPGLAPTQPPTALPVDPGDGTLPVPTRRKRKLRSRLPSAPPINQQRRSPPSGPGSNDLGGFGGLRSTIEEVGQASFPPTTVIDPDDIFRTATRPCHIAHRRYTNWTQVVYSSSISPHTFVKDWRHALGEMRVAFGFSNLPDIFVFNQFLNAVAANPAAREWIDSLHLPMDKPPAASVMEETYRDFLRHEARRLGLPRSTWDPQPAGTKTPPAERTLKHYCPLHHILTKHSKEDCPLLPKSDRRKPDENKDEKIKKDETKK